MLEDAAASQERHKRFLTRVVKTGVVWALRSDKGWCVSPSNEHDERSVMPFWSDRAYALRCAKEEWSHFVPTQIRLMEFIGGWLPGLKKDGILVGTNWNAALCGMEIEPAELQLQLIGRLNQ